MGLYKVHPCTGTEALYRPYIPQGSEGIALLFHDQQHQKGVRGQRHVPAALYPRERPGTHFTGGWVGPRAGLDRCGKSRFYRDSIPGTSSPQPVAIPTELSRSTHSSLYVFLISRQPYADQISTAASNNPPIWLRNTFETQTVALNKSNKICRFRRLILWIFGL